MSRDKVECLSKRHKLLNEVRNVIRPFRLRIVLRLQCRNHRGTVVRNLSFDFWRPSTAKEPQKWPTRLGRSKKVSSRNTSVTSPLDNEQPLPCKNHVEPSCATHPPRQKQAHTWASLVANASTKTIILQHVELLMTRFREETQWRRSGKARDTVYDGATTGSSYTRRAIRGGSPVRPDFPVDLDVAGHLWNDARNLGKVL